MLDFNTVVGIRKLKAICYTDWTQESRLWKVFQIGVDIINYWLKRFQLNDGQA